MSEKIDFLIVGGGIAGRLLQMELEKRKCSTMVYDQKDGNECSMVAGGLANPLVGKYFTIGWRAREFFAGLDTYYQELESRLSATFFTPRTMKRIISSPGEQNIWLSKAHLEKYKGFCVFSNEEIEGLHTELGLLEVQQGGEMNAPRFLEACQQKLSTNFDFFDHEKLDMKNNIYDDIHFSNIVFCEGYKVVNNPFFNKEVEIVPTKGELLEIETDLKPSGDIYLGSVFIQHLHGRRWRVGATYERYNTTVTPTAMQKEDLMTKLEKKLTIPYTVVNHYCGVRPASLDRKPLLGVHPSYSNMFIFNGMGSKAVSLAPLLAREMCDFMIKNTPLHSEIDIKRFC